MGCKTDPKSDEVEKDSTAEQSVTTETIPATEVSMSTAHKIITPEQTARLSLSTPHIRLAERPHSAHIHRVCGQLLRLMGDKYLCNTCGKTLQTIGDTYESEYAIRKVMSCGDLSELNIKR